MALRIRREVRLQDVDSLSMDSSHVEHQQDALDDAWMARLFPNKDVEKRAKWLDMLQKNAKPATLRTLATLGEQAWKEIGTSPNPPTPSSIRV